MSERSPEIIYPFPQCKDCPLAKAITEEVISTDPYEPKDSTALEKVSISCVVDSERTAVTGALRLDSYISAWSHFIKGGEKTYLTGYARQGAGNSPDFCPQNE